MKKLLIVIDPGHCGKWNQGAVKEYWEGEKMYELACKEKEELEKYGIDAVILTRTAGQDPGLQTRGKTAVTKGSGYEHVIFMSDHSNAFNGNAKYVVGFRSAFLPKSEELGKKLVAAITSVMAPETGAWNNGLQTMKSQYGYDYYGVINAAVSKATTVADAEKGPVDYDFLFEHGFHDNLQTCQWLVKSENLQKIAEAKAKVIAEYFGFSAGVHEIQAPVEPEQKPETWYRVFRKWWDWNDTLGSFRFYENAKAMVDRNPGYFVFDENGTIIYPAIVQTKTAAEQHADDLAGTYTCTAGGGLNVRYAPGTGNEIMACIPEGHKVECNGLYTVHDGTKWLLISFQLDGKTYKGFASMGATGKYLKK